jgi:histidine triad (HIT) family protein
MNSCIFCKIVKSDVPSYTIFEDKEFLAFLDIKPLFKGHALIIPKKHYETIRELPENLASKILVVGKKLISIYDEVLKPDGYNILQSNGGVAGQDVMHYHIHLVPRYKENPGLKRIFSGIYNPTDEEQKKIAGSLFKFMKK